MLTEGIPSDNDSGSSAISREQKLQKIFLLTKLCQIKLCDEGIPGTNSGEFVIA